MAITSKMPEPLGFIYVSTGKYKVPNIISETRRLDLIQGNQYTPVHIEIPLYSTRIASFMLEQAAQMVEDKFDFVGNELLVAETIRAMKENVR